VSEHPLSSLDAEVRDHIERETQDNIARGMEPEAARRAAFRKFGNAALVREDARAVWIPVWLDQFRQDIRYAVRSFRRTPGFALVAVLTLAIGIGASTAICSVVNAILFQPLPFPDSDRLVRIVENYTAGSQGRVFQRGVTFQTFLEWRKRSMTLSDVTVFSERAMPVQTDDGTARLWGGTTSANTFALLGAHAMLGRALDPGDDANPNVVVLGFDAWRRLFHSDATVVGRQLELRESRPQSLTIVGVLPAAFEFPTGPMDFYVPFARTSQASSVTLIGRIRPGVSLQQATAEANLLGTALQPPRPATAPPLTVTRFEVQGLKDQVVKTLRPALRVLLAAVAVLLAIVCANVANLLLARGTARQREMSVRFAIGAGRGRVIRQIVTECLVLAIAGGAFGAMFGAAGISLVKRLSTIEVPGLFRRLLGATILPRGQAVGVDLRVLGVAFGITAVACLVFGLLPALKLSRPTHLQTMRPRGASAGRDEIGLRGALVVGQMAMATMLLVGAALLLNSFVKLSTVDKGYDATRALALQLIFPGDYTLARKTETIDALLTRLRADPNVENAGFSRAGVLIGEEITLGTFVPKGRTLDDMRTSLERPRVRSVSQGFLPAMGIRFLAGRDFAASDNATAPPVVVINRLASSLLFGQTDPIGQFLDWDLDKERPHVQVVGVVEQLRNESLEQEPFPEIFVDYRQLLAVLGRLGGPPPQQAQWALGVLSFAIRTKSDPEVAIPTVRQTVRAVDPNAGIDAIIPVERLVSSSLARQRLYAVLLGLFAGVASLLAAIGIYGVLAFAVAQRTQEIGIRMALGAQRGQVLAFVLRKGLALTAGGIALGIVAAAISARVLDGMLFGVTALDPTTFLAVSLAFGLVATVASYVPARRATRVDPIVALRMD